MTYCYRPNIFSYIFAKNFYSKSEKKNPYLWKVIAFKDHHCLMKFNKGKLVKNSKKLEDYIKKSKCDVYMPKKNLYIDKLILNCFAFNKKKWDGINF